MHYAEARFGRSIFRAGDILLWFHDTTAMRGHGSDSTSQLIMLHNQHLQMLGECDATENRLIIGLFVNSHCLPKQNDVSLRLTSAG